MVLACKREGGREGVRERGTEGGREGERGGGREVGRELYSCTVTVIEDYYLFVYNRHVK